ncbi:peptidylprolyl isomerase [Novosphingobium sp. FSY-8]|uniref:Peptidyl-prolyl cis-trans isomerase n=1 Tax=Novosphingobium ovatum TaxID=1908523 RepID=A0ABW9XCS6_9SPHN|nr:peptidylprolyl isomerase [Novosphingobium ovatum]NBC36351.1 peptidylprolyl isomerase [Novosphingobium ovatum]
MLATSACAHKGRPAPLGKVNPTAPASTLSAKVDQDIAHDPDNVLLLDLSNGGRVAIRLVPAWAPTHVERIKTLAKQGFYNGVIFHRVVDGFMAQTGDPTGTGGGGSPLPDLKAEFNSMPHVRGSVSMARTDNENSANSQFFITFYPHFSLDRHYTNFGRVIAGMETVDAIMRGEPPANPTKILQASLASEGKARMLPPPPPPPAAAPSIVEPAAPKPAPAKPAPAKAAPAKAKPAPKAR